MSDKINIHTGSLSIANIIAALWSWNTWHDYGWAALHGALGLGYILYRMCGWGKP